MFFDFAVTRDGLANACLEILIPIMPSAVTNKNAVGLFNLPNQVISFHASCNSPTCLTLGIALLVRSA